MSENTKQSRGLSWGSVSRRLVPVFAVITALIITVPLMMATGGGSLSSSLGIAGRAYAGLLEGSLGLAFKDVMSPDNLNLALELAEASDMETGDASAAARRIEDIETIGVATVIEYGEVLERTGLLGSDDLRDLDENFEGILESAGVDPESEDGQTLALIAEVGARDIERAYPVAQGIEAAGITDFVGLESQLRQIDELVELEILTSESLATAITEDLPAASQENLLVRRPGNRILVDATSAATGITYEDQNTEDTADDEPETLWLKLGDFAVLFFPRELEGMITRSIPFIIAGLAVALGFKAGLFNIGAEGQLYAGAIIAVFVGYSTLFAGLPAVIHLPLVVVVGITGGLLWGAIPGALKAYTGAHEVITTIMLNFIAVRFVDWLVNTEGLMRDPNATLPQSTPVAESARLPRFDLPIWFFVAAAVIFTIVALYLRREQIQQNARAVISPILNGVLVFLVGIFLSWITVRDNLHVGLLLMIFAVWFTDWFLTRTTFGFEIRTVGANANAARYGGMSVPRNLVLAMALSGALAGLAGMIEMSGVQYTMQPEFFSGLGFDAIAVALLARTNPRNMIAAGLLWGGLYAGAPLMQTRAEISIDLVRIIQALIIMFIAADAIIRYLWRVPEATPEERAQQMFSTSWGS
ncbi:MAG: ABC transporter permease [Chloroflexota bacterium]